MVALHQAPSHPQPVLLLQGFQRDPHVGVDRFQKQALDPLGKVGGVGNDLPHRHILQHRRVHTVLLARVQVLRKQHLSVLLPVADMRVGRPDGCSGAMAASGDTHLDVQRGADVHHVDPHVVPAGTLLLGVGQQGKDVQADVGVPSCGAKSDRGADPLFLETGNRDAHGVLQDVAGRLHPDRLRNTAELLGRRGSRQGARSRLGTPHGQHHLLSQKPGQHIFVHRHSIPPKVSIPQTRPNRKVQSHTVM